MIRDASISDVPLLIPMIKQGVMGGNYKNLRFLNIRVADFLFDLLERGQFLKIYTDAGEIVGVMAGELVVPYFSTDKIAIDQGIFVHHDHRTGKVSKSLIESFVEWSKKHGAKQIRPCISTGNNNSGRSYTDLGFELAGQNFFMEVN